MSMERREVKSTRVVKSGRSSSQQNLSEFDNNLDHLLEDLQNTVSRPGSSLGNAYTTESRTVHYETNKNGSLGRVQHLNAANPTVTVQETVSYKPGQKQVTTYKTESYSTYNTGTDVPDNVRMQNNINKLDTLLDDLKQVRQGTLEKTDHGHTEMKLLYNDKITDERRTRSGSISREIELNAEGTYGKPLRQPSPARPGQVTRQVHEYKYVDQAKSIPSTTEITTVDNAINPNVLANLDPSLLPSPNTKVTTTIKTYTYEIPGTGGYPQSMSPKLSETVFSSNPSTPSKSFSYNKIENHSSHNVSNTSYPGDYIRPSSPQPVGWKKQVEVSSTKHSTDTYGKPISPTPVRSNKENYAYNESRTTSTDYRNGYPSPSPNVRNINVYKETSTTKTSNQDNYPVNGYPNNNYPGSINKTYIINESHTTRNVNQYGPNGYPPTDFHKDIHTKGVTETFDPKRGPSPYSNEPPRDVNITYKYTTSSHTSNNYRGHPHDEMDPMLHTPPFPTDSNDGPQVKGPPKKLDELMAEFGNEPPNNQYNAGYNARQAELVQQRKEQKEVQQEVQKKDFKNMPKTSNVAGPPVYYPPDVEMFAHKEQSAGYRAEGGMMKESEKYKYEASAKSKSKEKSGVAVVPVCLPLCCGLPCAIL